MLKVNLPEPAVKQITLLTPSGVEWNLTEKKDRGVFLREGGISGLVGTPSPLVSQAVGAVGQRFFGAEHGPLEGTLSLSIYDESGGLRQDLRPIHGGSIDTHTRHFEGFFEAAGGAVRVGAARSGDRAPCM